MKVRLTRDERKIIIFEGCVAKRVEICTSIWHASQVDAENLSEIFQSDQTAAII